MELPDHQYFQPSVSNSEERSDSKTNPDFSHLCRICASSNEYLIPIFDGEGVQLDLSPKIEKYLPVTINSTDELPTSMCYQCASSILSWHDLVENCVTADKQLRNMKLDSVNEIWAESNSQDSEINIKDSKVDDLESENDNNCDSTSSKEVSSTSCKESNAPVPVVSVSKLTVPQPVSNVSSNDGAHSPDANRSDVNSREIKSEKLLKRAKSNKKASKVNGIKEENDPELMVSLVPEVKLVEGESVLGKRKRKRTSYFSYGDFVYDSSSFVNIVDPDNQLGQNQKKSKLALKNRSNSVVNESFPCQFCPKKFSRRRDTLRHEQLKHSNKSKKALNEKHSKAAKTAAIVAKEESANVEGNVLTCDKCQSQFDNKLQMVKHLHEMHSDSFSFDDDVLVDNEPKSRAKRYFCNLCSTFVIGRKPFLLHHKLEHPDKKHDFIRETSKQSFHCDFCSSGFTRYHDLFRHLKNKHLQFIVILDNKQVLRKQIICGVCEAEFSRSEDATLHIKQSHNIPDGEVSSNMVWACSLCEAKFDTIANLAVHGSALHAADSDYSKPDDFFGVGAYSKKPCPATCDVCGLTFKQRYQLTTHKSKHITMEDRLKYEPAIEGCRVLINNEAHFRCNLCSRMFSKEDLFIRHLILHDTGRAFCCDMCGFQCVTQSHLKRHMNVVHLKKRDFKCDICGHAFAEKQAMVDHRRTHTGERPCQCKICGKMFPSWTCVYTHKRSHTDYFPYPCTEPDCKSKFRTKYRLKEHMRRHTGEKPFACPIASCGKTFHDKRAIARHLTVHSNARPYACTLCNRLYKHKKYLSFHMKANHGMKMSQLTEEALPLT